MNIKATKHEYHRLRALFGLITIVRGGKTRQAQEQEGHLTKGFRGGDITNDRGGVS